MMISDVGNNSPNWRTTLIDIMDELTEDHLKRMKCLMEVTNEFKIPKSMLEGKDRYELVTLVIEQWGEEQSIYKMLEIIKKIPRKDLIYMFDPFIK